MSIQRKIKREQQIQGRKALRAALKEQVVQDFAREREASGFREGYVVGVRMGKESIAHAADHLEYTS